MRNIIISVVSTTIVCTLIFVSIMPSEVEPEPRQLSTVDTVATQPEPEIITETVTETVTEQIDNPETLSKLEKCSQAFYDLGPVLRAYFDAMRAYESGQNNYGRINEDEGERLYAEQANIFYRYCDEHVTNRQPSPWG